MMAKLFGVVLADGRDAHAEVIARAKDAYASTFAYSDTFLVLRADENTLSSDIAVAAGLKGEGRIQGVSGFVIQLRGAYSGHTRRDLWEWLSSQEGDE